MWDCCTSSTVWESWLRSIVFMGMELVNSPPTGALCQNAGMGASALGSSPYQPPFCSQPSHSAVSFPWPVISL